MVEFTSETEKSVRPITIAIALAVIALMVVAVFFVARRQKEIQPQGEKAAAVYVPGIAHPGDPNFEYYSKYIRIENAKASLGLTFSKARIAMISGIIANEGDRKLEAVELRVTLYDIYGKPDKDVIRYPVRPGLPPNRPMEPLERRTFTIAIESVEQLWNPNRVQVDLTGLKYLQ